MFAIIESGGKQYFVEAGHTIKTEIIPFKKEGDVVSFDKILFTSDGKKPQIGSPYLSGMKVVGVITKESKGKKLIAFKYRHKGRYRRKVGHRQKYFEILIKEINVLGETASEKNKSKNTAAKPKNPRKKPTT